MDLVAPEAPWVAEAAPVVVCVVVPAAAGWEPALAACWAAVAAEAPWRLSFSPEIL